MPAVFEPVLLPSTLWVVLGLIGFLQILGLIGQIRQGRRLRRLERSLQPEEKEWIAEMPRESLETRQTEVKESKKQFQAFLEEDPSRKELPKKEQFAEFRKWRTATGLNWVSISKTGYSPREKT